MRYNLKSVKIVLFCTTNTTTNANEIKALTRVESEILGLLFDRTGFGLVWFGLYLWL